MSRQGVPWAWVIVAVTVLAVVTMFAMSFIAHRPGKIADAKEFTPQGPPCVSLTADQFKAQHLIAPHLMNYDDITFGRIAGDVSCNEIKTHGGTGLGVIPVCQFTSPGNLTVTLPGGQAFYFNPGIGRPATVSVQDGAPRCVVASNYRLGD